MNRKFFWFGYVLAIGALFWVLWRKRRDEIEEILERVRETAPAPADWVQGRQVSPRKDSRVAPAVPAKERSPSRVASNSSESDDLQRIVGIGPIFAARLQNAGITSYAQLAELTPKEVRERIDLDYWRENVASWITQAGALSG